MRGPVSSLGEEVGKDSTAGGGQGNKQERWDHLVETAACKLQKIRALAILQILFYILHILFYFTDFVVYFTDFILHNLLFILQILLYRFYFYFTDFIFYFTDFILKIITDIELYGSEYSTTTTTKFRIFQLSFLLIESFFAAKNGFVSTHH